jgi:oligosaccharide repeat unit polymerase
MNGHEIPGTTVPAVLWTLPVKVALVIVVILMMVLLNATIGGLPVRPITFTLAIASVSFFLVKGSEPYDLFNPVRVFGALWCLCLSLASMRLIPIISDWNSLMWSCLLTGLVSFIAGFALAGQIWKERGIDTAPERVQERLQSVLVSNGNTLLIAAACIVVGTAVLGYEYHLIGGIPILADDVDFIRMELFGVAGNGNPAFNTLFIKIMHFFVEFTKYGVFLSFIVLVQRKPKSRRVVIACLFLMFAGTLAYVSQAGRTFMIDIVVTCAVLFHYLRQRIRFTQLVAAGLVIFIFLGIAGSLRTQTSGSEALIERIRSGSGLPEGQFWDGVGFGYLTLTESFEVFYRLTSDLTTTTKPAEGFTLYGFHRFIPRANIQEFAADLYTPVFITPTYLGEFYADYGLPGILLGSLILGLFYGWAYSRGAEHNRLYWIYVRAMLITMLFFFPYVNLFSQQVTWLQDLFFMYLLIRLISPGRERSIDSPAAIVMAGESAA